MSLRTRILTLVAGFVAMALAVMFYGLATLSDYNRMMADYGRAYENAYMGERLNHLISAAVMESRGIYHSRSLDEARVFADRLDGDLDQMQAVMALWRAEKVATPDMDLDGLEAQTAAFIKVRREVVRLSAISIRQAEVFGIGNRPMRIAFQDNIEGVVAHTRHDLAASKAQADAYRQQRVTTFIFATLGWIVLTALLSLWVISHFITRELARDRVEYENREKLLKQLMESNTELERFAYVASHDMQEPVRMVKIFSQLIAKDYDSKLDDTGRQYLGLVTTSASRMHALVHDLLHYSRLKHEREADQAVDLNRQLELVRANFTELVKATGAQIETDGPLPAVSGNPVQIQRLLGNLIGNAIKYQPAGQIPVVRIAALDRGDQWLITIKDNGLGVEPQFATEIFEPFRRLHTWSEFEGSGMGLAICRKIVERHGGRIWVEVQSGAASGNAAGACFCFTLPKAVSAEADMAVLAVA